MKHPAHITDNSESWAFFPLSSFVLTSPTTLLHLSAARVSVEITPNVVDLKMA